MTVSEIQAKGGKTAPHWGEHWQAHGQHAEERGGYPEGPVEIVACNFWQSNKKGSAAIPACSFKKRMGQWWAMFLAVPIQRVAINIRRRVKAACEWLFESRWGVR